MALVIVLSACLPWVYYPGSGLVLNGYLGDGILFIAAALIVVVLAWRAYLPSSRYGVLLMIAALLAGLMTAFCWYKIFTISSGTYPLDPTATAVLATPQVAFGLHLLTLSSTILTALTFIGLIKIGRYLWFVTVLVSIAYGVFYFFYAVDTRPVDDETKALMMASFDDMSQAMIDGDIDTYISYGHPMVVAKLGGPQQVKNVVSDFMKEMTAKGDRLDSIEITDVASIHRKGKLLQASIRQDMSFLRSGVQSSSMIAVSEDYGKRWYFISYDEGASRASLVDLYPLLLDDIEL